MMQVLRKLLLRLRRKRPPILIKQVYSPDRRRMVEFEQRSNGIYTFEEWYFSDEPYEHCWFPIKRDSWSLCDSLTIAEREAAGRIEWLGEMWESSDNSGYHDEP